jgi:hypothetical protein
LFVTVRLAPRINSAFAHSSEFLLAAMCRGVFPATFLVFMSAPKSINSHTQLLWFAMHACFS